MTLAVTHHWVLIPLHSRRGRSRCSNLWRPAAPVARKSRVRWRRCWSFSRHHKHCAYHTPLRRWPRSSLHLCNVSLGPGLSPSRWLRQRCLRCWLSAFTVARWATCVRSLRRYCARTVALALRVWLLIRGRSCTSPTIWRHSAWLHRQWMRGVLARGGVLLWPPALMTPATRPKLPRR